MLTGMTALDLSSIGPGPRATRVLADYGMRIVKIKPPARAASIAPPWFAYSADRGVTSLRVDLKQPDGVELVRILARGADALIESYRPGIADRLGIGYDALRATNESLVYCSITGFGQHGPYAHWPAHDINWLALGGLLGSGQRLDDGAPAIPGATIADTLGGHCAVTAILAALLRRARTGEGSRLDVSVLDAVLGAMRFVLDAELAGEQAEQVTELLSGRYACYHLYRAADDRWLAVGAIEPHFWRSLCEGLGLGHRIDDQLVADLQPTLVSEVSAAFARRPRAYWARTLGPLACVTPVASPDEVLDDPHLTSLGAVLEVRYRGRPLRQLAPRLPIAASPDLGRQPTGPTPARDVDRLLAGAGLPPDDIARLRRDGVVS